jgi:hypothetical protein
MPTDKNKKIKQDKLFTMGHFKFKAGDESLMLFKIFLMKEGFYEFYNLRLPNNRKLNVNFNINQLNTVCSPTSYCLQLLGLPNDEKEIVNMLDNKWYFELISNEIIMFDYH